MASRMLFGRNVCRYISSRVSSQSSNSVSSSFPRRGISLGSRCYSSWENPYEPDITIEVLSWVVLSSTLYYLHRKIDWSGGRFSLDEEERRIRGVIKDKEMSLEQLRNFVAEKESELRLQRVKNEALKKLAENLSSKQEHGGASAKLSSMNFVRNR